MLVSMTGFGRAFHKSALGLLTVEIQSLNRKFLEIAISLPKELGRFESEVRKWIGEVLHRGHISVRVTLAADAEHPLLPPIDLFKNQKKAWDQIAKACGYGDEAVTLAFLYETLPPYVKEFQEQKCLMALKGCTQEALKKLVLMKQDEGRNLEKEIRSHLEELKKLVSLIRERAPFARTAQQAKLKELIQSALQSEEIDDRILQSIVSFSDRIDCTEELARLDVHCAHFEKIEEGKALDFLTQEMGRELNTIGSKASDLTISHLVVAAKSEMEKIKEQIQNIE